MVERDATLDRVFGALSDRTRRAIMRRLSSRSASVSELAEPFEMSFQAVSKHLKVLERAGLLRRDVDGRVHRVRLNAGPMREASRWIGRYRRFWETQLDALADYMGETSEKHHRSKRSGGLR